jgi:hypothetical protein
MGRGLLLRFDRQLDLKWDSDDASDDHVHLARDGPVCTVLYMASYSSCRFYPSFDRIYTSAGGINGQGVIYTGELCAWWAEQSAH